MCGQIGVSTTAGSVGWRIGPAGGEVVGGGAGGRGDDQAVGAEGGDEERRPRVTSSSMIRDSAALVITTSLRTSPIESSGCALLHDRAQHPPLLVAVRPVEHALEGRVQLGQRDLGEEAEAAEVDAQDGHRAVERDGWPRAACRRRRGRRGRPTCRRSRGGVRRRAGGGEAVDHAAPCARRGTPAPRARCSQRDQLAHGGAGLAEVGAHEDADRAHAAHRPLARRPPARAPLMPSPPRAQVQEELAVPFRAGDGRRARPAHGVSRVRLRRVGHVRSARACSPGSLTIPPRPTWPRPTSNCGFTSTTASASGRQHRAQRGQHLAHGDERHVHGGDAARLGHVQRRRGRGR